MRGVRVYRSRGKLYTYHRATGKRIRAPFGSAAFVAEIERLNAASDAEPTAKPGSLGHLIAAYRASPEFSSLAPRTRADYQRIFDYLRPLAADALANLTSADIIEIRDAAFEAHKRRFANYVLSVLRLVLQWAIPRDLMGTNPAAAVPPLRRPRGLPQANRAWSEAECEAVLSAATGGVRIAIALGMFCGMREGDALRLPRSAYDGAWLRWRQGKTGSTVEIPTHPTLKTILDEGAAQNNPLSVASLTMVFGSTGRPYGGDGFRTMFFRLIKSLQTSGKVAPGLTFHGLRRTVATRLAEAGCNAETIMAVTGHTTEAMVSQYTRGANRKRLASAAITKMSNGRDKGV